MTVDMHPDLSGMSVLGGVELLPGDGCRLVGIRVTDPPDVGEHTWLVSIVIVPLAQATVPAPQTVVRPPAARTRIHGGLWVLCVVAALWWLWFLLYLANRIH